jgi:hypothetical protein
MTGSLDDDQHTLLKDIQHTLHNPCWQNVSLCGTVAAPKLLLLQEHSLQHAA